MAALPRKLLIFGDPPPSWISMGSVASSLSFQARKSNFSSNFLPQIAIGYQSHKKWNVLAKKSEFINHTRSSSSRKNCPIFLTTIFLSETCNKLLLSKQKCEEKNCGNETRLRMKKCKKAWLLWTDLNVCLEYRNCWEWVAWTNYILHDDTCDMMPI